MHYSLRTISELFDKFYWEESRGKNDSGHESFPFFGHISGFYKTIQNLEVF